MADSDPYSQEGRASGVTTLDTATPVGGEVDIAESGSVDLNAPEEESVELGSHFDNLAETLDSAELSEIASDLIDAIEIDKEAHEKRDQQYEEGLRRTGLGNDSPGGASFAGASRATHPALMEAALDFSARVMSEMLPPEGPVKDFIVGEPTDEKEDRAKRTARYMNYQITELMPSAYHEFEMGFTQCPLGGAFYSKMYTVDGNPSVMFVPIDKVHRPWSDGDFYSQPRLTHEQDVDKYQFNDNVRRGLWLDVVAVAASPSIDDQTKATTANDRIVGRGTPTENIDDVRVIYEVSAMLPSLEDGEEGEDSDGVLPYIVTIDVNTRRILSIYRNWREDDENRKRLDFLVEWPFWPWRGGIPIGMTQMIGSLAGAATGALRALLDAAFLSNSQTGMKLKGGATTGGQNIRPQVGQTTEVSGSLAMDDIRKTYMPLPFNPPSAVLFQLLGFLVDSARGVVRTTFDEYDKMSGNTPVGTASMFIEQGLKNFGAVHGRLHRSMRRFLRQLWEINSHTISNEVIVDQFGELNVTKEDFQGPMTVIPVSDPRIFSDMQRSAQAQMIQQRATTAPPGLYDLRKSELFFLKRMNVPDPEQFLVPDPQATQKNAVAENVEASRGLPIKAYPGQDHEAHLAIHLAYLVSPMFGSNPIIAMKYLPVMLGHLAEHLALWYADATLIAANAAIQERAGDPTITVESLAKMKGVEISLDRLLAEITPAVLQHATEQLAEVPPIIMQAQQLMQKMAPPMPMDPSIVAMKDVERQSQADQQMGQAKIIDIQSRTQMSQAKTQMDQQRLQIQQSEAQRKAAESSQKLQMDAMVKAKELEAKQQDAQAKYEADQQRNMIAAAGIQSKEGMNAADNATAIEITEMKIDAGEGSGAGNLSTGTGVNPNP